MASERNSSDNRLYRLFMAATVLATATSIVLTVANIAYGLNRPTEPPSASPTSAVAPNYPERGYRIDKQSRTRREFRVLGLPFLQNGFLSPRAATAMLVGSFFWPLLFFGYSADLKARQREAEEASRIPR